MQSELRRFSVALKKPDVIDTNRHHESTCISTPLPFPRTSCMCSPVPAQILSLKSLKTCVEWPILHRKGLDIGLEIVYLDYN
jgi:hypothetical protein